MSVYKLLLKFKMFVSFYDEIDIDVLKFWIKKWKNIKTIKKKYK